LGGQLYRFQPTQGGFSLLESGRRGRVYKPLGFWRDGLLVAASYRQDTEWEDCRLEAYDGSGLGPLPDPLRELPIRTNLLALFTAQNGDLWLSSELGTAWYHSKKWRLFAGADRSNPQGAFWFAEPAEGRVWCATRDRIWEFDGRNWLVLRAGFDRINALQKAGDGGLWVAANSGLTRWIPQVGWVENGKDEGLPGTAIREVCEDRRGRTWAGTAHGLSRYYPEADLDPPRTQIQELGAKEANIPEGGAITLAFSGEDRWHFTRASRLLYSHRLDGGDWSPYASGTSAAFADLQPGKHYFDVRAMDRNGNVDPKFPRITFTVILPWYKEARLVVMALGALAATLFFAGLAFNRHRQLARSYVAVEQKVAQRTRELEAANRALAHSQKMNALGTLAAGIAHDFNNILSIIQGSAQIIEENLENPQKVRLRLDRIKTVVEQGAGIVKAMLGFSRGTGQEQGPCDVNEVVDETLKLLGDRFLREVQLRFERAPGLPPTVSAKDFIQQIVLNFVLNAAESMGKNKQLILKTERITCAPTEVVLEPGRAGSYLTVAVQDYGCGIAPENLSRIFEPFFTTKALSSRRGTGLGLSMVYELAKKMEAGLAVESVVGQGSTFTLILPVRELADAQPPVKP
jgi:signal transduction histidine kinase